MIRDITKAQFAKKLEQYGMSSAMCGYYHINLEHNCSVYAANGGDKRRSQLAYLIQKQQEHEIWLIAQRKKVLLSHNAITQVEKHNA